MGSCTCAWGGPCQFNALPAHGRCQALVGRQIGEGHLADTRLDGVGFARRIYWWPGTGRRRRATPFPSGSGAERWPWSTGILTPSSAPSSGAPAEPASSGRRRPPPPCGGSCQRMLAIPGATLLLGPGAATATAGKVEVLGETPSDSPGIEEFAMRRLTPAPGAEFGSRRSWTSSSNWRDGSCSGSATGTAGRWRADAPARLAPPDAGRLPARLRHRRQARPGERGRGWPCSTTGSRRSGRPSGRGGHPECPQGPTLEPACPPWYRSPGVPVV